MDSVYCPNCKADNLSMAEYCTKCGTDFNKVKPSIVPYIEKEPIKVKIKPSLFFLIALISYLISYILDRDLINIFIIIGIVSNIIGLGLRGNAIFIKDINYKLGKTIFLIITILLFGLLFYYCYIIVYRNVCCYYVVHLKQYYKFKINYNNFPLCPDRGCSQPGLRIGSSLVASAFVVKLFRKN